MNKIMNIFFFTIILIFFLSTYNFYSSNINIDAKEFNRLNIDKIIDNKITNLPILNNDTYNIIEFNDNYLTKPLNYISIESVKGKNFNSSVDKILEISQKDELKDFDQLSSKFFNLSTSSILYEYFSKRFLNYIETSSNGDLFFSDFDTGLKLQLGIVNSSNSAFVDEITTGYAKGKGLFFFSNDFTDINNNLEIEFSYKHVQSSKYFNKSFKKNITLKNHSLILFPGLLSYKIINSNKFDLNFCTLEFNNS